MIRVEVCRSTELTEGESRVFEFEENYMRHGGFVLRWQGEVAAYLNSCPHTGAPLDWGNGLFFNTERSHLQCANHMAVFDAATGACLAGPCAGRNLTKLPVAEIEGMVVVTATVA